MSDPTQVTTYLVAAGNSGPVSNHVRLTDRRREVVLEAARKYLPGTDRITSLFYADVLVTRDAARVIGEQLCLEGKRVHAEGGLTSSILPHVVHGIAQATALSMPNNDGRNVSVIITWPGLIYTFWSDPHLAGTMLEHGDIIELTWDVPESGRPDLVNCQLHTDRDID